MIRPIKNLDSYQYYISDVQLSAPDFEEPITIPGLQVRSLTVIKNYESNIVPLMLLCAHVNKEDYEKVITSMKNLTAQFTVYKSKEDREKDEVRYNYPCISGTFKTINSDLMDTRTPNKINQSIDLTNNTQSTLELNLYLYDYKSIINYKKNHSYIIHGNMNDLIFNMLKDREFKNILFTPCEINETDFIIPYGNLKSNLDCLDEYYGIYRAPRIFFADYNTTYMINEESIGITLRDGEYPTVSMYLEETQDQSVSINGSYVDDQNGMYILNASPFSVDDTDTMADFYVAGKLISLVSGTNKKFEDVLGDYEVEKAVIIYNEKSHDQFMRRINESKRSITTEFSDIDIDIISPNKKFILITDPIYDQDYDLKGTYRLKNCNIVFSRQAENLIKCVTQCTFAKA